MLKSDVKKYYGSFVKAAQALGVSPSAISQWGDVIPENKPTAWKISHGENYLLICLYIVKTAIFPPLLRNNHAHPLPQPPRPTPPPQPPCGRVSLRIRNGYECSTLKGGGADGYCPLTCSRKTLNSRSALCMTTIKRCSAKNTTPAICSRCCTGGRIGRAGSLKANKLSVIVGYALPPRI